MKKSELKAQIEELITEILSEATIDVANPAALNPAAKQALINKARTTTKNPKIGTADDPVEFLEETEDDDDSSADKEPTKSELRKNAGVAKVKDELAKVTKEMKDLAKEYTKAEGDKKDKIKTQLKDLTAKKKDLEKKLDKAL